MESTVERRLPYRGHPPIYPFWYLCQNTAQCFLYIIWYIYKIILFCFFVILLCYDYAFMLKYYTFWLNSEIFFYTYCFIKNYSYLCNSSMISLAAQQAGAYYGLV